MRFFKALFCVALAQLTSATTYVEKMFVQGPQKNYLMNSSTIFLPTDSLTMNSPVFDARTVVINSGVIGGLDSLIPAGLESRAFKDSNDGEYFYQIWHFAHIDDKHSRTNVVTAIVSIGNIGISPSGDIEDANRRLDTTSSSKVYIQVYRTWSIPSVIPLTQSNIDGWWHSITHVFHTAMHIWNEVRPWIGIARTVIPILVSLDDAQPGLGLKSIKYSLDPQSTADSSSGASSVNQPFTYALTPGEMSAVVIFVYLSGAITAFVVPQFCINKPIASNTYKLNAGDFETRTTLPLV
jgi:hypothetical protein